MHHGGKILVKWDSKRISFMPLKTSAQMIHGELSFGNIIFILLSIIYAHNSVRDGLELWDSICELTSSINRPWVLMGDFNCNLYSSKKIRGNPVPHDRVSDFRDCLMDTRLIDLSSFGLFTWSNLQKNSLIQSKLDRVLCNHPWINDFPHSFYKITPPLSSYHSPLITMFQATSKVFYRFMFRNYWTLFPNYTQVISKAWSIFIPGDPLFILSKKLANVRKVLKFYKWDSNSLDSQITSLNYDQRHILSHMEMDPLNPSLINDLVDVNNRYKEVASKEHSWLKERAKAFWLTYGDDDIQYLYHSFKERKNRNFIKKIHLNGDILCNNEDIGKAFCGFYSSLFLTNGGNSNFNLNTLPIGKRVSEDLKATLIAHISDKEICML